LRGGERLRFGRATGAKRRPAASFHELSAEAMAALEGRAMKQDAEEVSWFKPRW